MIKDRQLKVSGGTLSYQIVREEAAVVLCHVTESRVVVPDEIEGFPVTIIDKKAFLSSKLLREVSLPRGLKKIGDWAFAYCSNLVYVWLPRRGLSLGKGVFKDCNSLEGVFYLDGHGTSEQQSGMLLGTVPVKLEAEYLFTPGEAGSRSWIARYDAKLQEFLNQPDEDGYSKMVYCGEEDIMANMDLYLAERRRAK